MAVDPKIRILLVEDASVMRKMEIKILDQLGFCNVVEAVDGNDAIEKLQNDHDIGLVLSDWAMPNKDGYELLTWVRNQEQIRALPMVMATGQGDKESVTKALQAGANGVVAKPFTPDDLKARIEEAFGGAKSPVKEKDIGPKMDEEGKPGKTKKTGARGAILEDTESFANLEGKYLTFGISTERYGISILDVREIIGMKAIRPVPNLPDFMKGVINLRGKVIPLLDMRLKFGMEPMEYTERTCIIVVEISGFRGSTFMGIVVDRVLEVADIKTSEVEECPDFGADVNTDFVLGIAKKGNEVTILVDIDRILQTEEKVHLAKAA